MFLHALCDSGNGEDMAEGLAAVMVTETTTLGVRVQRVERLSAPRRVETVQTQYGVVRVKVAALHGAVVSAKPEYDDCARLAAEAGVPMATVAAAASREAPSPGSPIEL